MQTRTPAPAPTAPAERISALDLLRGCAIFGILLVNMQFFSGPFASMLLPGTPWPSPADRAATWLIRFFGEGKFYPLLSFLFGLGAALQMIRLESQGLPFARTYVRRLLVLLGFGIIHAFLIWSGDILIVYALLGFLVLPFRQRAPRTLVIWAIVLLSIPVLLTGLAALAIDLGRSFPESAAQIDRAFAEAEADYRALADRALTAYPRGTFSDIMAARAEEYSLQWMGIFAYGPNVLAFFLLGLYAGRRWGSRSGEELAALLRTPALWAGAFAVVANAAYATARDFGSMAVPSLSSFLAIFAGAIGAPATGLVLIALAFTYSRRLSGVSDIHPLAAVGRTAISNYLFQSVVCTFLFYSYGLGLYSAVGPAAGIGVTLVLFALQLVISPWWLRRFRFGPVEWLWRSLTYGRRQPLRIRSGAQ